VKTPRRGQNKTKSKTEQKDQRRHDLDRGGMGYVLAQRDGSKSDREGLEEPEERRERKVCASRRRETEGPYNKDRTRSERGARSSDIQQRGYRRAARSGSRMSAQAPGELHLLRVRGRAKGSRLAPQAQG
jgi:hypothetical protein